MNTNPAPLHANCHCAFDPRPHAIEWCTPSAEAWRVFEERTLPRWAGRPTFDLN